MVSLKTVVLMLLDGDEVVISDDLSNVYKVVLEKAGEGVDFSGETTLLIRSDRLKD